MAKLLRRDQLCAGTGSCEDATVVICLACLSERDCGENSDSPWPCPECGSEEYAIDRCAQCPLDKLDEALWTDNGRLVYRALDLEHALSKPGMAVRLDEIPEDVYRVLEIIDAERVKVQAERTPKTPGQVGSEDGEQIPNEDF